MVGLPGLGGDGGAPAWTQAAILGQMQIAFFMPLLMSMFLPAQVPPSAYQEEMEEILDSYSRMTGQGNASEEIWALTGVYTQFGYDQYDQKSTQYGVTDDGWIYGARVGTYRTDQYGYVYDQTQEQYIPDVTKVDQGELGYTVEYIPEKGLYYYTQHGSDLRDITDTTTAQGELKLGSLYTRVHMDTLHKSSIFITSGGKHEMDNGTFYYEFDGYRYSFSPLEDYNYDKSMNIKAKNSSCSLIWYQYTSDSGIQGQLVVSGTDSGIAYVTGQSIVRQFDQQTSCAKFTFRFSGVDVYMYVQMDPYALYELGMNPEDCYNNGYFSIMITTPKYVTSGNEGGQTISFDINKMWDVQVGLFTFSPEKYGLEHDSIGGMVASVIFVMPLYAQLFALGTIFWPILIVQGILAQIQQIGSLWPF